MIINNCMQEQGEITNRYLLLNRLYNKVKQERKDRSSFSEDNLLRCSPKVKYSCKIEQKKPFKLNKPYYQAQKKEEKEPRENSLHIFTSFGIKKVELVNLLKQREREIQREGTIKQREGGNHVNIRHSIAYHSKPHTSVKTQVSERNPEKYPKVFGVSLNQKRAPCDIKDTVKKRMHTESSSTVQISEISKRTKVRRCVYSKILVARKAEGVFPMQCKGPQQLYDHLC